MGLSHLAEVRCAPTPGFISREGAMVDSRFRKVSLAAVCGVRQEEERAVGRVWQPSREVTLRVSGRGSRSSENRWAYIYIKEVKQTEPGSRSGVEHGREEVVDTGVPGLGDRPNRNGDSREVVWKGRDELS